MASREITIMLPGRPVGWSGLGRWGGGGGGGGGGGSGNNEGGTNYPSSFATFTMLKSQNIA